MMIMVEKKIVKKSPHRRWSQNYTPNRLETHSQIEIFTTDDFA